MIYRLNTLQTLDILVNAAQLPRNGNTLRAMRCALVTANAMACLTEFGYTAVIADQKSLPRTEKRSINIIGSGDIAFRNTFVVMREYGGNIYSVRTWHTIIASRARN